MRVAILSDIHANLVAFQAVLDDADGHNISEIWFLGDLVMYGPCPRECIDLMRQRERGVNNLAPVTHRLRGNNDDAFVKKKGEVNSALDRAVGLRGLNADDERRVKATKECHTWTAGILTEADLQYLSGAADQPIESRSGEWMLLHASPCDPVGNDGNYLRTSEDAEEALVCLKDRPQLRVCFFGHSHITSAYQVVVPDRPYANVKEYRWNDLRRPLALLNGLGDDTPARWLINPGSVGQPRDKVRDASYAIFDDEMWTVEIRRVPYDWQRTVDALYQTSLSGEAKNVLSRRIETGGAE